MKIVPARLKAHLREMIAVNELTLPERYEEFFWVDVLAQHYSFVAVDNGRVVGYCLAGTAEKTDVLPTILSLAVLSSHRRRGIARRLLNGAFSALRDDYKTVQLSVRVSNAGAQQLYTTIGFVTTGTLPQYYSNEDGYHMTKIL
jgi:ribosomal protein S18 acetylase RimI-like enzyme